MVALNRKSCWDQSRALTVLSAILVFALACGCYYNALEAGFTFDDHLAIEDNSDSDSSKSASGRAQLFVASVWKNDFWGRAVTDAASHHSYRPITILSFRAQHYFAGGRFVAFHFHAANVLLHAVNSVLALFVFRTVVCSLSVRPRARAMEEDKWDCTFAALLGALLFAVHPIHTEAVTSVVGRAELLSVMGGFVFFLLYARDGPTTAARGVSVRIGLFLFALLCVFPLSLLAKDSAVTMAAVCITFDFLRLSIEWLRSERRQSLKACLLRTGGCVAVVVSYALFRIFYLQQLDLKGSGLLRRAENPHLFMERRHVFLWYLQLKNIALILWPWPLCVEYSYNCLHEFPATLVQDSRILWMLAASAVLIVGLLWVVQRFVRCWLHRDAVKSLQSTAAIEIFAVVWFGVTYLPVSHLLVTVGTMLAERCLYLPSVAACLVLSCIALAIPRSRRSLLVAVVVVILSVFVHLSITRNSDWYSDETVFESAVRVCPDSAKHKQQLALVRFNQNRLEEGRMLLEAAEKVDPDYCEVRYHLARYHYNKTNFAHSCELFRNCSACAATATKCYTFYRQLRAVLYPMWTGADLSNDSASLMEHMHQLEEAGSQFRQAGLAFANESRFCPAADAMMNSARIRGSILSNNAPLSELADNGCNVLYWAGKYSMECSKQETALSERYLGHAVHSYQSLLEQCRMQWVRSLPLANSKRMEGEVKSAVHNVVGELATALNLQTVLASLFENKAWKRDLEILRALAFGMEDIVQREVDPELQKREHEYATIASHLALTVVATAPVHETKDIQSLNKMTSRFPYLRCEDSYISAIQLVRSHSTDKASIIQKLQRCANVMECPQTVQICTKLRQLL